MCAKREHFDTGLKAYQIWENKRSILNLISWLYGADCKI